MPWSLKRYYETNALHFITFSCAERKPLLTAERRDLFEQVLEEMRVRYQFVVVGYVVMPEHIHLLISEPEEATPSTVIQAVICKETRQRWVRHFSRGVCARSGEVTDASFEPLLDAPFL